MCYQYFYCVIIIICLYLSICVFFIGMNGFNFYIQNILMIDNNGKCYHIYYFIPLCLFTNYFDKKIYKN